MLGASLSLSSTAIVLELLSNQERLTDASAGRASRCCWRRISLSFPMLLFISIACRQVRRLGACQSRQRGSAGGHRACRYRRFRPLSAASVVPAGGYRALRRTFHCGRAVRRRRRRRDRRRGRPVDGARRLRCRILLAETEYHKAVEATVAPVKGLLLGMFFFTVGMSIDFRELLREPLLLPAVWSD